MSDKKTGVDLTYLIFGGIVSFLGVAVLSTSEPKTKFWGMYEVNLAWTQYPLVVTAMGLGAYFFYKAFSPQQRQTKDYYICTRCELVSWDKKTDASPCPKCGGIMENGEGFYKRHPELLDETGKEDKDERQK